MAKTAKDTVEVVANLLTAFREVLWLCISSKCCDIFIKGSSNDC